MTVAIGTARADRERRTILDAAGAVFLEDGYSAAGMDEVAARAGASKVTVYKHFSDKQRLFVAVVPDAIGGGRGGTRSLVDHLADERRRRGGPRSLRPPARRRRDPAATSSGCGG